MIKFVVAAAIGLVAGFIVGSYATVLSYREDAILQYKSPDSYEDYLGV